MRVIVSRITHCSWFIVSPISWIHF